VQDRELDGDASNDALLELRDVVFHYGKVQVLFNLSFEVAKGEMLGLLGSNGAGKSTVLRIIAGLDRPDSGRVRLGRDDITGLAAEAVVRRGVVLVPGGRGVFPDLSVSDNLELQALVLRNKRQRYRERRDVVLTVFPRLAERLAQRAGTLSGGEQQMLALAKAFLLEPVLLCIDELSLGLAPVVVEQLLEAVKTIHEMGTSIVLVEQSLNIAAALCARAVFMERGEVRFVGSTADLLERADIADALVFGGPATIRDDPT
jgi:ABC-type branched-subunit amino acid transport system ATPase component